MLKKILGLTALVVAIVALLSLGYKTVNAETPLVVHFFDAGKADAILISYTPSKHPDDHHFVLIDTGEASLAPTLLDYFSAKNITSLDYLIITHFDKDHVGSASEVIKNLNVAHVLQSNFPKDSPTYSAYLSALEMKNLTPETIADSTTPLSFSLGSGGELKFTVAGPTKTYEENTSNNSSLITSIEFGEKSFLFMGDAENARLKDFLDSSLARRYDFLKVPYHGHSQSQLENLLSATLPSLAVITSSNSEPEDAETLELLEGFSAKTYLTREGAIDLASEGKILRVSQ